jgi:hypothetical protein
MRSLNELINMEDPAWPLVQEWMAGAPNRIEVLPVNRSRAEQTLLALQVTTRSPMGALALETGGLFVDHGWLRLLGSGCGRMQGDLCLWNGLREGLPVAPIPGALVVAHDAVGGFFAINGGAFAGNTGRVFYFAPDSLEWYEYWPSYSDFLYWVFHGDLQKFYEALRWPNWAEDVWQASGDQGFHIYPPPFAKEGGPAASRSRRLVPMAELWGFYVPQP